MMRSNTHIAKAEEEMPAHGRVVKGMTTELKDSIGVRRKDRSKTLLGGASQFARVVKAAVNRVIGFLVARVVGFR